ncbi:MAG: transposase [Methylophilaceae bacterium]|nr:transposase [Methylophilaceae bacterium]
MKRIPCRLFTEEFKREPIKLVTEQHINPAAAGLQLDIDPKSIRSWIAKSERGELKATLGASKFSGDQQSIRELDRELAIAREERDILKRTTAYFAKLTGNPPPPQKKIAFISRIFL